MAMTEVTIYNIDATRTLDIVRELREHLVQERDFTYEFHQGGYDWENNEHRTYRTVFRFHNPADATAFSLRYL